MKDATPPATQRRLLDLLLAAINGIVDALIPIIDTVDNNPNRPWLERTRLGDRFWAIIRELFALTTRIEPESLPEHPTFPPIRPHTLRPNRAPAQRARFPTATLSPRQLAKRLAALLYQLLCLAAEANAAVTPEFNRLATQLRTIAGCDARPPQTWETTG